MCWRLACTCKHSAGSMPYLYQCDSFSILPNLIFIVMIFLYIVILSVYCIRVTEINVHNLVCQSLSDAWTLYQTRPEPFNVLREISSNICKIVQYSEVKSKYVLKFLSLPDVWWTWYMYIILPWTKIMLSTHQALLNECYTLF